MTAAQGGGRDGLSVVGGLLAVLAAIGYLLHDVAGLRVPPALVAALVVGLVGAAVAALGMRRLHDRRSLD